MVGAGGLTTLSSHYLKFSDERTFEVKVLNPYGRVPVSLIIDDSTCLVNMAHYGIPQFGEVFPDQYKQDWRKLRAKSPTVL